MPEIQFDAATHSYTVDGVFVPSVTQVLNEEGLVYFPIPEDQLAFCAWRGSAVHLACLYDDEGTLDESTVQPEHRGYLEAWRKGKAQLRPTFLAAEQRLYHPALRYAGTLDRLVQIAGRRRPQLWDLKTGVPHRATCVQTAAYAHLHAAATEDGGAFLYDRFAVRLTKEGNYTMQQHPLIDLGRDFELFCSALRLNRWKRGNR